MLKTIAVILLFVLGITFIFQNQEVFIHEFFLNYDMKIFSFENKNISNGLLMIYSFLLGVLISLILIAFNLISKNREVNRLKKKIIESETKIVSKEEK
ncbi:DUF1049 domain-containing protein [bacterium]|jgi:uncharacterized integral membrane protein|nr:DUF1049 domain-containing protein [bacterium]MBT3850401.1 DUF1049 domain-containing protein [bacterium]MBT4435319.1 DUF1049 domain-containing protein [bacterium]MDG2445621.1 lipopolysaccharide assembly protein LapA domain-containing protein [Thermodesulfobacteriota bacterium]|tara:strand:+ start:11879 stop:12172 length:294 start_codon:yes stop_codon:yes gene_type:complete